MTRSLAKSNAQFQKAIRRLPLGVSSNFRYWGEDKTIYVKSAKGARLTDIDGNEYIDYRLAYGPCILGYADPRVDAAARAGIDVGGVFALSTEREYAVAERISSMVPAAELVRFSNSGTEAVMAALRVARAYTGKDSYVVIEGGYHGVFDAALWTTAIEDWHPGHGDPQLVTYSAGVPARPAGTDPRRADERRRPPRKRVQGLRRRDRGLPHRADHGQLLLDLGHARVPARRARALRQVRHPADHRRGEDGLSRRPGRRAGALRRQGRHLHLRQGDGQRLPDLRVLRPRRHHAQVRPGRRARRHLHLPLGRPRRGRKDTGNPGRDPCPRDTSPTTA